MTKKRMYQILIDNKIIKENENVMIDYHVEPISEQKYILFTTKNKVGDYNIDTNTVNIVFEM